MSVDCMTPGTMYGNEKTATAFDKAFETDDGVGEFEAYPKTFLCTWWC